MRFLIICITTLTTGFIPLASSAHDHARVKYLGNEGLLIQRGETKVLFDAFYAQGYGTYVLVPEEVSADLLSGVPPYDNVSAIFISHVHGDHFTAEPAIAYLRAHPDVRLFGPTQVRDAIVESGIAETDPLLQRITALDLAPESEGQQLTHGALSIDVVAIPHAGNRPTIQNYAWRVSLDEETTVIHLGDAGPSVTDFSRHQAHFDRKDTHTAFPPYWFLGHDDGELILSEVIKAGHAIGIHVPKAAAGNGETWRKKHGGDLFTDPGEERIIGRK